MLISRRSLPFLAPLLLLVPGMATSDPLGRAFTYQGQLSQAGVPVDSTVTLPFSLWNMAGSSDPPVGVTASAESNGTVARFAMVNGPTTAATWVRIVNGSGSAADCDFYFHAIGPR